MTAPTVREAPITREELTAHLKACRIAGFTATTREANLRNYSRFARRDPEALLGLDPERDWTTAELLALMAEQCGVSPDPEHRVGPDVIDPARTVAGLDRLGALLAEAATARAAVLLGTGHPAQLLAFWQSLAAALAAAGCAVLTPARGARFGLHAPDGEEPVLLDYPGGVGVVYEEGASVRTGHSGRPVHIFRHHRHSHSPQPVRLALHTLSLDGGPAPDLVLGDHGWIGGAARLGLRSAGLADSNDCALFVGAAEGLIELSIPLDDAVRANCYELLTAYVLQQAGLSP